MQQPNNSPSFDSFRWPLAACYVQMCFVAARKLQIFRIFNQFHIYSQLVVCMAAVDVHNSIIIFNLLVHYRIGILHVPPPRTTASYTHTPPSICAVARWWISCAFSHFISFIHYFWANTVIVAARNGFHSNSQAFYCHIAHILHKMMMTMSLTI